jgi:dTDP-4-dehydrorhamnose reductase
MRSAYVLGSKGMLGSAVSSFLNNQKGWTVEHYHRGCGMSLNSFVESISSSPDNFVFNCIGAIPQKKFTAEQLYEANFAIPAMIASKLAKEVNLIHPSSDCVFSGKMRGTYSKNDTDYSLDSYGLSKRASEALLTQRANSLVIRASIIGKGENDKGLLSWILLNKNKRVPGYENHFWNGLTSFEWIKQVIHLIEIYEGKNYPDLVQLGTEDSLSKAALIQKVSDLFDLNIEVMPVKKEFRSLVLKSDYLVAPLDEQLLDFKKFFNLS